VRELATKSGITDLGGSLHLLFQIGKKISGFVVGFL
jgi:hypothetical protein